MQVVLPRLIASGGTATPKTTIDEATLLENLAVADEMVDAEGRLGVGMRTFLQREDLHQLRE